MNKLRHDPFAELLQALEKHGRRVVDGFWVDLDRAKEWLRAYLAKALAPPPASQPSDDGERLLDEMNLDYAALRRDPAAWQALVAERDLWEHTAADGLTGGE